MQVGGTLIIDSRVAGALFAVPCITRRIMQVMPLSCVLCSATSCVLCSAAARPTDGASFNACPSTNPVQACMSPLATQRARLSFCLGMPETGSHALPPRQTVSSGLVNLPASPAF